jgi:hypothetical protein
MGWNSATCHCTVAAQMRDVKKESVDRHGWSSMQLTLKASGSWLIWALISLL